MSEHTIRLYRRFWRRITLECQECHQCLASGRSGSSPLRPDFLWSIEQNHRSEETPNPLPIVHYPEKEPDGLRDPAVE